MKKRQPHPTEWILHGAGNPDIIAHRHSLLTSMFSNAKSKGADIAQLRQRNLNYALLIFAALFTFGIQLDTGWFSVGVAAALCFAMFIFSSLDRRFHKFIHGWRETEKHLIGQMVVLLNKPEGDVKFRRYISEAENGAEVWSWQPCITYALVVVSVVHFAWRFWLVLGG